jgi:hypothetical protein
MTATQNIDEETPLLTSGHSKKATPLPWTQFSIVLFLQLAEPLTSNVIYPFMPQVRWSFILQSSLWLIPPPLLRHAHTQLIRDLGVTNGNDAAVGYYVGMMVRNMLCLLAPPPD